MSKWIEKPLGELVTFSKGKLTRQSEFAEDGYRPLINADAVNGKVVSYSHAQRAILCDRNDVLMLWDGERSGLVTIGHTGVVGSTFTKLKASDLISSKYLFHFLNERFSWIQNNRTGTGVPHVPKDLNRILIIKYPEKKEEQIEIARIIDTVDGVIELTLTSIAKCQAIKQGILHDLFTRGIEIQTGKLRPKYNDAPELYKESKLGMVPKEWDEIPLEELSTQIGDGIHTTPKYADNTNYYFINGNNLLEGEIIIDDSTLSVSFDEYKKHFKELNDKTILYSINGTIGNIALYRDQKVILGKSACYISCKSSVNLDYIFFALQTEEVFKFFENEMTGSTIKNLSLASIRATPIRIPKEKSEQNQIANKVRGITEKLRTEQTYLLKLQQLKAGLMGDLLSGKKKVKLSIGVD